MKNSISPTLMDDHQLSYSGEIATPLVKVSLSLALVAVILHTVGMACPYWLVGAMYYPPYGLNRMNIGVFQGCSDLTGCTSARGDTNDWQKASAALEVVAELLCLCDIVTLFAAMFKVKSSHTWKYVKIASSMLTLAAALSMVVPLALYGTNANKMYPGVILNVGWAYVLVCVSAIMQSLSGVTLIIELLV